MCERSVSLDITILLQTSGSARYEWLAKVHTAGNNKQTKKPKEACMQSLFRSLLTVEFYSWYSTIVYSKNSRQTFIQILTIDTVNPFKNVLRNASLMVQTNVQPFPRTQSKWDRDRPTLTVKAWSRKARIKALSQVKNIRPDTSTALNFGVWMVLVCSANTLGK